MIRRVELPCAAAAPTDWNPPTVGASMPASGWRCARHGISRRLPHGYQRPGNARLFSCNDDRESLEMLGVVIFLYALLDYIRRRLPALRVGLRSDDAA